MVTELMRDQVDRVFEALQEGGIKELVRRTWKMPQSILRYAQIERQIERLSLGLSPTELLDFAMGLKEIAPIQVVSEIAELLDLVRETSPHTVLEIGTHTGGSLFLLSRLASPNAEIISIDLPTGKFGGGYSIWRESLYKSFARPPQTIHLIRGDSHSPETREKVTKLLDGRTIEFLFIDGDHTYDGVKRDFQLYSQMVEPGRFVAFHDVAEHPSATGCEVSKFWNEVKRQYPSQEFIEREDQGWAGIGVLQMGCLASKPVTKRNE